MTQTEISDSRFGSADAPVIVAKAQMTVAVAGRKAFLALVKRDLTVLKISTGESRFVSLATDSGADQPFDICKRRFTGGPYHIHAYDSLCRLSGHYSFFDSISLFWSAEL